MFYLSYQNYNFGLGEYKNKLGYILNFSTGVESQYYLQNYSIVPKACIYLYFSMKRTLQNWLGLSLDGDFEVLSLDIHYNITALDWKIQLKGRKTYWGVMIHNNTHEKLNDRKGV